jgi:hypothetical protein
MFEMFMIGLYASLHIVFAVKAATSSKLLKKEKRGKWIALSLAFGFVGHFVYYSLQLDDEYVALRSE